MTVIVLLAGVAAASAETRSLKLYFIHTKERAEITYWRNGRYLSSGLDQINRFLRDWRRNEPTTMDPRLIDLLWEVNRTAGGRDYIHIISAYRSPATNSMLRSRSNGVAKNSQHTLGKAIDFFIPGVSLSRLRAAALRLQQGGVGFYPSSGSPFVHIDVGSVRHWPRMNRSELLALFPDGRTAHIPSDGKPLAGYNQALASIEANRRSGGRVQIASASESEERPRRGLLSVLFGGADEEEDQAESVQQAAPRPAVAVASAVQQPAPVEPDPTPETILASLASSAVPLPQSAPRTAVDSGQPLALASADAAAGTSREALDAAAAVMTDAGGQPVEVALNIPLPTQRPDYAPDAVGEASTQMAEVAPGGVPLPAGVPTSDPQVASADAAPAPSATVAAYLPLPSGRPGEGEAPAYVLASLPDAAGPSYGAPPISTDPADAVGSATNETARTDRRLARLGSAPAASQRQALISGGEREPDLAIATGVRTTAKGSKPVAGEARRDARPVLVPIPQQVARWALNPGPTELDKSGTRAPALEVAHVRTAPRMVYTSGFGYDSNQAQANRFTGKAVNFLSVARFGTN